MTPAACAAFRSDFEPGLRGPHFDACPACRTWALDVEAWRAIRPHPALPAGLRRRLLAIPAREASGTQAPLPPALRARLLRIPAGERARRRVLKARYAVAASYLLAGLLTLAAGGAPARPSAHDLAQASARGTELLRGVGGWILAGCGRANETMDKLFGRLGAGPAPATSKADPETEQEDTDGTRKAP